MNVVVVGAGIFGVTAARALRQRGCDVRIVEPGPIPHPLAASTDISKVVRLEYGADDEYTALGERALAGWRQWNDELGEELFHETGVLFMRQTPIEPGTFEGDSYTRLARRGHPIEVVAATRFPEWSAARYPTGIWNRVGGWVQSGRVVEALLARALTEGVRWIDDAFVALREERGRVVGITTRHGDALDADVVVAALGSWTPYALPFTQPWLRAVGMPVFHLRPREPQRFVSDRFPVFGADISTTGYYGFPLHPTAGVVKIANHGVGRVLHPESADRVVRDDEIAALRAFLATTFPSLVDAELTSTRVCLYCDTWDGHFWIAPDPERAGLVLATGGSGHAYKFAPELGALIADAVSGQVVPKFRWRPDARPTRSDEAARRQ